MKDERTQYSTMDKSEHADLWWHVNIPVLEITVGHWPLSDHFQHLADQNPFWLVRFPVHFQWDSNQ